MFQLRCAAFDIEDENIEVIRNVIPFRPEGEISEFNNLYCLKKENEVNKIYEQEKPFRYCQYMV